MGILVLIAVGGVVRPAFASQLGTDIEIALPRPGVATVRGHAISLRRVIEDLCFRAGIELRSYDAPDRPTVVSYAEMPLAEMLRQLLRQENFLIGMTDDAAAEGPRVSWLQVLSARGQGAHGRSGEARRSQRKDDVFRVPPLLLNAAFAATDPEERRGALESIARHILSDSDERRRFLGTDPRLIAEALDPYPGARAGLSSMEQHRGLDDALRAQIAAIVSALAPD